MHMTETTYPRPPLPCVLGLSSLSQHRPRSPPVFSSTPPPLSLSLCTGSPAAHTAASLLVHLEWIKIRKGDFFVCLFCFLTSSSTTRLCRGRVPRLTSDNFTCCHTETERGDHDFCLSRLHYTYTDPTSRERAATAGIEPRTSSPEVPPSTH